MSLVDTILSVSIYLISFILALILIELDQIRKKMKKIKTIALGG